jgi:hypothetical protein
MSFPLEYHRNVIRSLQRSVPASLALSGALLFFTIPIASAQANNAASFGASHVAAAPHATPPTHFYAAPPTGPVTPRTGPVAPPTAGSTHTSSVAHNGNHHPHHTAVGSAYYPYIYALPVPYAVDTTATDDNSGDDSADNDADYQGGPTIFDRRGNGPGSYVPPMYDSSIEARDSAAAADPDPDPPQEPTMLIFKDGHQLEVTNYAIVSQTLYDLTPGHPRKISLAELNLPATQKENDDHGIVFQLPPSSQAN